MSTEERIERFNEENAPFYLVDHGNEYSLCFLLGGTPTAAAEYGQYAFDHYAETVGKPVEENGWLTYGDGYDWECVFKEAFENDPAFHKVYFDCESSGFFCISEDLSVLESFGSSFKSLVENREEFTRLSILERGDDEWHSYDLKDVSVAAYKADRKSGLSLETRQAIFEEALDGKELVFDDAEAEDENEGPVLQM